MTALAITLAVAVYFGVIIVAIDRKLAADRATDPDPRMTQWLRAHPRRRHIPFIDD
jgi:hypothetical protein